MITTRWHIDIHSSSAWWSSCQSVSRQLSGTLPYLPSLPPRYTWRPAQWRVSSPSWRLSPTPPWSGSKRPLAAWTSWGLTGHRSPSSRSSDKGGNMSTSPAKNIPHRNQDQKWSVWTIKRDCMYLSFSPFNVSHCFNIWQDFSFSEYNCFSKSQTFWSRFDCGLFVSIVFILSKPTLDGFCWYKAWLSLLVSTCI